MPKIRHPFLAGLLVYLLINAVASVASVHAAATTLHSIREGLHDTYSRLVFDCEGALPESVGPARSDSLSIRYGQVVVAADLKKISERLRGGVTQITLYQGNTAESEIRLTFTKPGAQVKSFFLESQSRPHQAYRLVVDVYPPAGASVKQDGPATVPAGQGASNLGPLSEKIRLSTPDPAPAASAVVPVPANAAHQSPATAPDTPLKVSSMQTAESAQSKTMEKAPSPGPSDWTYAAQADLMLSAADDKSKSVQFETYRDRTAPAAADLSFEAEKARRLYFKGHAAGVGRDDPSMAASAGRYGKYDIDFAYDRLLHRYAGGVRTLYSGVGSGTLTLDDGLQSALQATTDPAAQATLLDSAISTAATGDPEVHRDRFKMGLNLTALDPLQVKIELGHELRQGTRPFAGAFGNSRMVELFEPIDYQTTEMKISAEYASAPLYLNFAYRYSQFTNGTDTLTFDNPLQAVDAVGSAAAGRIDLAPDNRYHNLSFTGALSKLPWNSRLTANAALGWMLQDDALVPLTSNTALAAPALPVANADAKVNTALYHLRLTSRPWSFMRLKADLRYYDYDNQTDSIDLTGGYVDSDATVVDTPIRNQPSSYTKTRAGLALGFDVPARSHLGLDYRFERTDRQNREVAQQDDNVIKASLDTRALSWLNMQASYERTDRKIGAYNSDVYLQSGNDIAELPQMRKYDQADMLRDRYHLQATVYPTQALALTGALTYGTDDYKDSPYGLLEDKHAILSFDSDYAVSDRLSLNLNYTYEKYQNTQRSRENGFGSDFDWSARGEDRIQTFGGGGTLALIPQRLDLQLNYAYSQVDGRTAFRSPAGSFADFAAVDDTTLHTLNTRLVYHLSTNLVLTLGYLWEKFDYEDENTRGFAYVPTDAAGNYQGALLAGSLPQDYDVQVVYTQLTFRYR